jgi:hypothetical protein
MTVMSTGMNPWIKEGVSILPKDTNDLLPYVGQKELFNSLEKFCNDCLTDPKLTSFFVLHGGWGVGKSRVGHEVCLEAMFENVSWIVGGQPQRVLQPDLRQGLLPIFIRYVQVTQRFNEDLSVDSWIPAATVEALSRLTGPRIEQQTGSLSKNQDRLLQWTEQALKPKGWEGIKAQLAEALKKKSVHQAARAALDVLKGIGINHLLIVVDEIEDITDVELDGLPSDERRAGAIVDQGLLTVIPRVIKSEEVRQEFPDVNFLLLCSRAVGDLLKQIRAIERRTIRYPLRSNAFSDVEDFFSYLKEYRPDIAAPLVTYPEGMKEAAFFAADRNFGWFNVIMHSLHVNQRGESIPTAELLRRFAETDQRVFHKEAIGSFDVGDLGQDKAFVEKAMYGLLPLPIGSNELDLERANRLLEKRGASNFPLFTKLREIKPPQDMRITTHLINCGFKTEPGAIVYLPGEARFNLKEVMDSLKAYSQIALPDDRREHLLISESDVEFTAQVAALSPYGDQASQFAPYLHGLLMEASYEVQDEKKQSSAFLAPSFTFLQRFHRLNSRRQREEGFLRDSTKNSRLAEAFEEARKDTKRRERLLLRGLANAWDLDRAPNQVTSVPASTLPAISMTSNLPPLNLGPEGSSVVVYCGSATDIEVEQDLGRLARRGAEPIVLVLEDQDQRVEELRERTERAVPKVAPFVVIHNLTRQVADFLVRLGLMGEAYSPDDLRTSHFNGIIQGARQHLKQVLDTWVTEHLEQQGLILRPLFYGTKVSEDELEAFAKGYAAMLTGRSYHDVKQTGSGVLTNDTERDAFDKLVTRQVDPGPKFVDDPRMKLVVEEGGDYVTQIPRCFVSLMERCSHVGLKRSDLEKKFVFDVPESVRSRDVMRQLTEVMHHLGLVERINGETIQQVSSHVLETQVKSAEDWLDSRFESAINSIKNIHQDEGARLLDIRGKEARQRLKEARKELDDLGLEFIGKSWDELNRISSDGMPVYEQELRKALAVVVKVKDTVKCVFDTEPERAFRYSADVLHDFEQHQASLTYPLWKRVKILHGFYSDVDKIRREQIKQINAIVDEVDRRVPALSDGQKAFPIQALRRPLDAFRQELDFNPDKPNRTVTAGGSSFAIMTVGYKICDGRYQQALERLNELESELTQPGKLVAGFRELLGVWEELRKEVGEVEQRLGAVEAFFADAPATVKTEIELGDLRGDFESLKYEIYEGGIRQGTDEREAAGRAILTLVDGLKADLDKVRTQPSNLRDQLQGKESQAVQSLEVLYQSKHRDLMRAWTGIRLAQNLEPKSWPQEKGETYGKTQEKFDQMVEEMQRDGEKYFGSESQTTFGVYVGLCRMELDKQLIDWDSFEYERHVNFLKRKKLLELKMK